MAITNLLMKDLQTYKLYDERKKRVEAAIRLGLFEEEATGYYREC
jgi:hypothetical protein